MFIAEPSDVFTGLLDSAEAADMFIFSSLGSVVFTFSRVSLISSSRLPLFPVSG